MFGLVQMLMEMRNADRFDARCGTLEVVVGHQYCIIIHAQFMDQCPILYDNCSGYLINCILLNLYSLSYTALT